MGYQLIQIPKLISKIKAWEAKKCFWLENAGTSFVDHFDSALAKKVIEAKNKKK